LSPIKKLWADGYFVRGVGDKVTRDEIQRYVRHEREEKRHKFSGKISVGTTATIAVFNNLGERGHIPIELERGSRGFEI